MVKFIDLHCSINHTSDNIAFRTKADECRIWKTKQRIKELTSYFPQN